MTEEYLSIDIEATGLDLSKDQVIQIGMVSSSGQKYSKNIRPSCLIAPDAEKTHGITLEMLKDCPSFSDVADEILDIIYQYKNIVMFNGVFDYSILARQFRDCGKVFDIDDFVFLDPFAIHKKRYRADLGSLYSFYTNKELENAHDATVDATATLEIFLKQQEKWPEYNVPETCQAEIFGECFIIGKWFKWDEEASEYRLTQGKYKGKRVLEVKATNSDYFNWIFGLPDISVDERKFIQKLLS